MKGCLLKSEKFSCKSGKAFRKLNSTKFFTFSKTISWGTSSRTVCEPSDIRHRELGELRTFRYYRSSVEHWGNSSISWVVVSLWKIFLLFSKTSWILNQTAGLWLEYWQCGNLRTTTIFSHFFHLNLLEYNCIMNCKWKILAGDPNLEKWRAGGYRN